MQQAIHIAQQSIFSTACRKNILLAALLFLLFHNSYANNITVSTPLLTAQNTNDKTVRIVFNVSWENSFRLSELPMNWDAAWVFLKYRSKKESGGDGIWRHINLSDEGHFTPGNATLKATKEGILLYRSAPGSGTFSVNGLQLVWHYGTHLESGTDDYLENSEGLEIKVFAIEMVYVPGGVTFNVGGGGGENAFASTNINTADASISGRGYPSGLSNNNPLFPNGYNPFYCMKYEISQQQYADFLNTLTVEEQYRRSSADPGFPAGSSALHYWNITEPRSLTFLRSSLHIQTPGGGNFPAVYGCDLDGDKIFNEPEDGQSLACHFLFIYDVYAFLNWCGLRPMTELEYEKACRGNLPPVLNEYAWGTNSVNKSTGSIQSGRSTETSGNSFANACCEYANANEAGPMRVGSFASPLQSRILSGASYYGIMDLTGNVGELVIHASNNPVFTGIHGDGSPNTNVAFWPTQVTGSPSRGVILRGGSFWSLRGVSARGNPIDLLYTGRSAGDGSRGVRTEP
jgi:formylglycine-generating enzyme required for sulfatase activity